MKYLKTYEEINDDPTKINIGDYVLLKTFTPLDEYLDHTIGEVNYYDDREVHVLFPPEIPDVKGFSFNVLFKIYKDRYGESYAFRRFKKNDIIYSSSSKEELEQILNTNKYNL